MDRLAENAAVADQVARGSEREREPRKARWEHPRLRRLATGEPRDEAEKLDAPASRR